MRCQQRGYYFGYHLFFGLTLLLSFPCPGRAEGEAAKAAVSGFLETIKSIEFPVQDPAHYEDLVRQAHSHLDLEAMVKAALIAHWDVAGSEDKAAFLELMWKLVENVAYTQSRSFLGDVEIEYPETKAIDHGWSVRTVAAGDEEALDVEVIYHLYDHKGRWEIYDVILDGVSMIEDLRYQFDKIIDESSFSGLLERMRDRLEKAEKQNQGDSP